MKKTNEKEFWIRLKRQMQKNSISLSIFSERPIKETYKRDV